MRKLIPQQVKKLTPRSNGILPGMKGWVNHDKTGCIKVGQKSQTEN